MQLPRVIIAAVFFVIGALIAVPALANTLSDDDGGSPQAAATTTPSETGSPSPSTTQTSASPSPGSPTRSPSPSPTRTTAAPPAGAPLRVTIGSVRCSDRSVQVTVHNTGPRTEDYAIEKNDNTEARPGRISPGATRTTTVPLREDRRTRVQVTWRNEPVQSRTVTANCRTAKPTPTDSPDELPHTGSDSTVLWARAATGGAAMITGIIIFWYGGIWPRRKENIFEK